MCLLAILLVAGCASSRSQTRTTTVSTSEEPGTRVQTTTRDTGTSVEETTTTTTTEETKKEGRGVIGTTFDFIGKVLAFPFKLIAGIFEAIF